MSHDHGGSIVGEVLAAHGVRCLYNLCGGHISPILLGAKQHGLEVVNLRHEASAAFAADAASRLTGIPGVCAVTAGPGVTNTVTAVKNAQEAQQPIVVLGGATATVLRGRGSLQDIDQLALMRPVTKWSARCNKVRDLVPMLERAFRVAVEGVPGPVFLEIPVDVLYPEQIVSEWYLEESGVEKLDGALGAAAQLAMKGYLKKQFHLPHLALPELPSLSLPLRASLQQQVERVAGALRSSQRPALVIGNQAMVNLTPDQADELAAAVSKLGLPTFLGGSSRGLLGRSSEIQFRHKRTAALREADVVLVAGFPFDFRMGYGQKINREATLVSVNLDAAALKKNRRPTVAVQAHPGRFLVQLAAASGASEPRVPWFETLREREHARDAEIAAMARTDTDGVDPVHLFQRIEACVADDSVLIVDGGDFVATGAYILRPRGPMSWLDPGVFGTLGVGGGFAVGAASVRPEAEVWLFYGDGSSAYSLAEFDTFVRSGLAPIAVIGTDASWQQIAREQVEILGDALGTELLHTAYHDVAQAYGGRGILVTESGQIEAALAEAKALAAAGTPVCINVHLAPCDFRKGSISI